MYNSSYIRDNITDAEYVPSVKFQKGKAPADLLNRINAIGKGDFTSNLIAENKLATKGAIIGLVSGFITAMVLKQNKFLFSIAGILSGAMVGTIMNKFRKAEAEKVAQIKQQIQKQSV